MAIKNKTEGQFTCMSCNGRKVLLTYITAQKGMTRLDLLCASCGQLQYVDIDGEVILYPVDQNR